ncbi:hypothetical protein ACFV9C_06590 [Kribbella sp. NPDC059898]|uniref:hypothetical protein n=1 Tax=Kribbella sp. NPDC059898 TaxID=3346995 RepID=UPI0036644E86
MSGRVLAAGLVIVLAVAGCSDSSTSAPPAPVSTPSETVQPPATPATPDSSEPTDTASSPDDSGTPDDLGTPTDVPPSGGPDGEQSPVPLGPEATNRPLTMSNIFKAPPGWRDGRFDVADRKQATGIGGDLSSCGDDIGQVLELRLANNFTSLKFDFGQSNASESSDQVLQVRVDTNGQYRDLRTVKQNQIASMSIPVTKVNALKIIVSLKEGEGCGSGAVQAVLMNLILT